MTVKCAHCSTQTDHPEFFFNELRSLRTSVRKVCPPCWQRRSHIESKQWLLFAIVLLGLAILLVIYWPFLPFGWFTLNLAFFQIGCYLSILPHELGHLFAAKFLGMRPFRMVIGRGRTLLSGKLFSVPTELRVLPISGFVLAGFITSEWLRLKQLAFAAAGPMANGVIAFVIWKSGAVSALDGFPTLAFELHPLKMLFFANAFVCLSNLLPGTVHITDFGMVPNDGKQILKAPFLRRSEIDACLAATPFFEAHQLVERREYEAAASVLEEGLRRFPDSLALLMMEGDVALATGRWETAREMFTAGLAKYPKPGAEFAALYNNIAYTNALLERPDLAREADQYSLNALNTLGWMASIQGTRGTVLVQFGKLDEGRQLLEASMAAAEKAEHKAENSCWIAIAAIRQGQFEEGERYIAQARALDPACVLIERAAKALRTRESVSPWSGESTGGSKGI
jgi:tetratricopeptide (TPR) repeat protein